MEDAKFLVVVLKMVESPDVSPVTSLLGSGANTIVQTLEGLKKTFTEYSINGSIRRTYW